MQPRRCGVVAVFAALTSLCGTALPLHFFRCHPPAKMQNFAMYAGFVKKSPLAHAGKNRFSARPTRRPNRDVPYRSTKCLGGLNIDVTGEYHAATLRLQVHAHGSGSSAMSTS